jgi:predicted RNase H-like HicB family nuclease
VRAVTTYSVRAERDGKWWALSVAGLPGALSQVRRLDQAEAMAREVISLVVDDPEDSFEVQIVPDLVESAKAAMDELDQAKASLAVATARVTALQQRLACTLVEGQGLTVRDAGVLMGVSFQRVAQLTAARPVAQTDGSFRSVCDEHGDFAVGPNVDGGSAQWLSEQPNKVVHGTGRAVARKKSATSGLQAVPRGSRSPASAKPATRAPARKG